MAIDVLTLALAKKMSGSGSGGIEVTGAEVGQTIVVKAVDENGKPTEWECADFPEGSGLTNTARTLLMTVLRNGVYTSDQSANLAALEEALKSSGGGSDEPDVPDVPDDPGEEESVIVQTGDTLYIVSGVTANQSGSVLVIA